MLHPHTQLIVADEARGYGVTATRDLPRGTLVWVLDALDGVILADSPLLASGRTDALLARCLGRG